MFVVDEVNAAIDIHSTTCCHFNVLSRVFRYTNARQKDGLKVNVFYSTPSCYLKALYDTPNTTWPTKSDDFFPYASDPHAYWTGYFSSRPTIKRFERVGNHFLQICKQLSATAIVPESHYEPHLSMLRRAMGIMQHHGKLTCYLAFTLNIHETLEQMRLLERKSNTLPTTIAVICIWQWQHAVPTPNLHSINS